MGLCRFDLINDDMDKSVPETPDDIPLIPGHPVYLRMGHGDNERMVHVFRQTWNRIPIEDREIILSHWAKKPYSVRVQANEYLGEKELGEMCPLAYWNDWSCKMEFWSLAVNLMDNRTLQSLIAHETAHAYLHATNVDYRNLSKEGREKGADSVCSRWRFSNEYVSTFIRCNVDKLNALHAESLENYRMSKLGHL